MSKKRNNRTNDRRLQFEQFEKRLVMSGQSIAPDIIELLPELEIAAPAITQQEVAIQSERFPGFTPGSLENAAGQAASIAAEYGFDGFGQTIAVIDSGIAYDHVAFGGGFGAGSRVVGGFDFAENDFSPYDDGPAGFHGTHVAGIIGSQDENFPGVSAGADLVALRVFDDNGVGDLERVEQALQFVIDNIDSYRFPITTVNLSLGTGWNAATTPGFGSLDDEFEQLNAAGVFVSVAAGNRFATIGEQALSYPAASPFVVPVASHGADGRLSDFSQRDDGVLVAPGELLRSSVPEHLFGGNRQDPFLTSSGTSQAAPYVAGASAILRQANEFVGNTDISQQQLYQQFIDSADQVFDEFTNRFYSRINFRAALEHVIADQYADRIENATPLGALNDGDAIAGNIGRLNDIDAIQFTAVSTGQLELTIEGTQELDAIVNFGDQQTTITGNRVLLNVSAGQEYRFTIQTGAGNGHYEIAARYLAPTASTDSIDQSIPTKDLGQTVANHFENQRVRDQAAFQVTAARDGVLTLIGNSDRPSSLQFQLLDSQGQQIAEADGQNRIRIDADVMAGQQFTLLVTNDGSDQAFNLTIANLVSIDGGQLTIHGTNHDDSIAIDAQQSLTANINGLEYAWAAEEVHTIFVRSHLGNDSIDLSLDSIDDQVSLLTELAHVSNQQFQLTATGFDQASVDGGGGLDGLYFVGSTGPDRIVTDVLPDGQNRVTLDNGIVESRQAKGFERHFLRSISGQDQVIANGSAGQDQFTAVANRGFLRLAGDSHFVFDAFANLQINGQGGDDIANLTGGSGNDEFVLTPDRSTVTNDTIQFQVNGFYRVNALASQGSDRLVLVDSASDDSFFQQGSDTVLVGEGFHFFGDGFQNIRVSSTGGHDVATLRDTVNFDQFRFTANMARLSSINLLVRATGFKTVNFESVNGGSDQATVTGTSGDDSFVSTTNSGRLQTAAGQTLNLLGIDQTAIDLGQASDRVMLMGSQTQDRLTIRQTDIEFESMVQSIRVRNFVQLDFDGGGGDDAVAVDGPVDLLSAVGSQAQVVLDQHLIGLNNFAELDLELVDEAIGRLDLSEDLTFQIRGL